MTKNQKKKSPRKTFSMKADKQRETLGFRDFFMHRFIVALFYILISEFAIKLLLDTFLIPPIQEWFFSNSVWDEALTITQVLVFVVMVFGELILGAILMMVPVSAKGVIQLWQAQLEEWAVGVIPEIDNNPGVTDVDIWGILLLLFLILLIVFLFAIPLILAMLWFAQIITKEVKRMEKQKEEERLKYEQKRNLLLSDIAHDLRTPITTIAGYSKALKDGMITDQKKREEYLEAIENKSVRMNELINLLFEYVKLDSDGFCLNKEKVDLAELVRENAALVYADVEEKGMQFEINIPEMPYEIEIDSLQFSRVITNLMNNAIKHNESGITIYLSMEPFAGGVKITVADTGTPIAQRLVEQMFEPFAVGDVSRKSKMGSGLGLSIAKKIIEMHGGTLEFVQDLSTNQKAFEIKMYDKTIN